MSVLGFFPQNFHYRTQDVSYVTEKSALSVLAFKVSTEKLHHTVHREATVNKTRFRVEGAPHKVSCQERVAHLWSRHPGVGFCTSLRVCMGRIWTTLTIMRGT